MLKLGKLTPDPVRPKLKFSKYLNLSTLPTPPRVFGYDYLVTQPFGMLGNDVAGDCVEAGAAHETMLWNAMAGRLVSFTPQCVLSDYSAATGYNPNDPNTDRGTSMIAYANYRMNTGVVDDDGNRHKIGAYADLTPGNIEELLAAMFLFGTVGIGIEFPQSAMDQFNAGEPWTVVEGSPIIGGHYISAVHRQRNGFSLWHPRTRIVTWGAEVNMSDTFLAKYCDEALVYFTLDFLVNDKSPQGFDKDQLLADLTTL